MGLRQYCDEGQGKGGECWVELGKGGEVSDICNSVSNNSKNNKKKPQMMYFCISKK